VKRRRETTANPISEKKVDSFLNQKCSDDALAVREKYACEIGIDINDPEQDDEILYTLLDTNYISIQRSKNRMYTIVWQQNNSWVVDLMKEQYAESIEEALQIYQRFMSEVINENVCSNFPVISPEDDRILVKVETTPADLEKSWSDELRQMTFAMLDTVDFPAQCHLKNIYGGYATISNNDASNRNWKIKIKDSEEILTFNSLEELISSGWAVD
jgi:preprotein translocase subunit SecD